MVEYNRIEVRGITSLLVDLKKRKKIDYDVLVSTVCGSVLTHTVCKESM